MRVVVVSPFPAERGGLEELLRDEGHEVHSGATRDEGLHLVTTTHPDVIIADAQLAGLCDPAFLEERTTRDLRPHTILLCPRANRGHAPAGVVCLTKPIDLPCLFEHLARLGTATSRVA